MSGTPAAHGAAGPAAARRRSLSAGDAEAGAFALLALLGAGMMLANLGIGIGWSDEGPRAGYFPFRVGALLLLASAAGLVRALRGRAQRPEPFAAPAQLRAVGAVFGPTALYVLGIQWLGLYVSSALFVAGFMRGLGRYGWPAALALPLAFSAGCYWLFEREFLIPLPKGPLETWLGL